MLITTRLVGIGTIYSAGLNLTLPFGYINRDQTPNMVVARLPPASNTLETIMTRASYWKRREA